MNINRCQYIAMWYAGIPIFMVVINTVYVYITGWWFQPLWKILVNGKDDIPYIMENKKCSKPPTRYIYISSSYQYMEYTKVATFGRWSHALEKRWQIASNDQGRSQKGHQLHWETQDTRNKKNEVTVKVPAFNKKKLVYNLSMYGWSLEQVAWNMFGTWDIKLRKETQDDDVDMSWVNNKSN